MKLKAYSGQTDKGPFLNVNEDTYDVDLSNELFFVLDGFGGSGIGDECSENIKNYLRHYYTKLSGDPDSTLPFYYNSKFLIEGNSLINAVYYAHDKIFRNNLTKNLNSKAGASGVIIAKNEAIVNICSVGNCRAYLYRDAELLKLVNEDSLANFKRTSTRGHFHTAPLNGFGLFEALYFQFQELRVKENDLLILMTDGVYARLREREMQDLVHQNREEIQLLISNLFLSSNERGNLDNQTCLILKF